MEILGQPTTASQTNPSPKSRSTLPGESRHPNPNIGKAIFFSPLITSSPLATQNHQTMFPPNRMGPANLFLLVISTAAPFLVMAQPLSYSIAKPSTSWINQIPSNRQFRTIVTSSVQQVAYPYSPPAFAAGFICASIDACDVSLFAVFIVYVDYDGTVVDQGYPVQVVWSANRDRPVRENATLEFTTDGNLVLHDADGSHVWSSNSSGRSVAGMLITEIGNLKLFDNKGATVWQSFHHPTDTLVLGQSLLEGMRLTSNISVTNTTGGQFYITLCPDGLYAYVESTPPQLYFSYTMSQNKTRNDPTKVTFMNGSISIFWQPTYQYDDNISLPAANSHQYMRFESDGHLRLYDWFADSFSGTWNVVYDVLGSIGMDGCAYPTACGEYGICTGGQYCTCPVDNNTTSSYFKLVDEQKPNLGCAPLTPISCQEMQHHQLLIIPDIYYFDENPMVVNAASNVDCQQACLKNCSCMAVLFRARKCMWMTKVLSLQLRQSEDGRHLSYAYLKVQLKPSISASTSNKNTYASNKKKVMVGATLGAITTLALLVTVVILYVQRRRKYEKKDEEFDFDQLPGMPTRFSLETLRECTDGFIKKLGEGGFGSVFEGILGEQRVAVKRLEGARQGKKEFLAEIETIGNIEHINLVSLIGFCAEKSERLLVYEYMSRGSLDRWIYYRHTNSPLDWCTRCRIILDIAKGLCYLHEECKRKIAHLDIKPQNILLDDNFNAKVADFGLCKLINRDQSKVMTVMRGTPGYLAPEWLTSRITEKVDVYSFGVVVMEIVSGRKNIDNSQPEENVQLINLLREKAQNNQLVDLIDKHSDDMVSHQDEVVQMMKLAIWCLQHDCIQRPSMSTVIKVLEGVVSIETVNADSLMFVQYNPSTYSVPFQASRLSGPR